MAVGSRFFLRDFDGGQTLSNKQEFALGQIGQDELGQEWSYVRFNGAYTAGQWVADQLWAVNAGGVNNSPPASRGGNILAGQRRLLVTATTWFAEREVCVGAVGRITVGGSAGDGFVITDWIAEDEVRVRVTNDGDDVFTDRNKGWSANFDGTTALDFRMPGRILTNTADGAATSALRGVVQRDVPAPPANADFAYHGWVQQTGIGFVRRTTAAVTDGAVLRMSDNGEAVASGSNPEIGRALTSAAASGVGGKLIPVELHIVNTAQAQGGPRPLTGVGMRGQVIS